MKPYDSHPHYLFIANVNSFWIQNYMINFTHFLWGYCGKISQYPNVNYGRELLAFILPHANQEPKRKKHFFFCVKQNIHKNLK